MLFTKNTQNTLKYHLVTAEPPFTVKTINWMHQTGSKILLSVAHMLCVNQVCHGVGRCVKDVICSSLSQSETQWAVLIGYLQSAYKPHYSTETAVLKVLADILLAVDSGNLVMLTLLDLSAAFDSVDHHTLLWRLRNHTDSMASVLTGLSRT